jgi:cobalt-zinc-cadmium resistance protein CzcA
MLFTFTGMFSNKVSANLMSLGALDFGIIVDGAVVIVENAIRRLAHAQQRHGRMLTRSERFHEVFAAARSAPAADLRAADHHGGVPADLCPDRRRRQDVPPDGLHRGDGAAGRDDPVGDLRPGGHCAVRHRQGQGRGRPGDAHGAPALCAGAGLGAGPAQAGICRAAALVLLSGVLASRMGSEFIPSLSEGDFALQALRVPGTSLSQSVDMQQRLEQAIIAQVPEVERVFARTGTAEIASDPMPPNISDAYVMLARASNGRPGQAA